MSRIVEASRTSILTHMKETFCGKSRLRGGLPRDDCCTVIGCFVGCAPTMEDITGRVDAVTAVVVGVERAWVETVGVDVIEGGLLLVLVSGTVSAGTWLESLRMQSIRRAPLIG